MIRDSSLVSGMYEIHRKDIRQSTLIVCEAQYVLCKQYMHIYIYIYRPYIHIYAYTHTHIYRICLVESIYGNIISNQYTELREKYMERNTRYEHLIRIGEEGIDNFHRDKWTIWE